MLSSLSKGYGSWTAGQVDPYYGEKYGADNVLPDIDLGSHRHGVTQRSGRSTAMSWAGTRPLSRQNTEGSVALPKTYSTRKGALQLFVGPDVEPEEKTNQPLKPMYSQLRRQFTKQELVDLSLKLGTIERFTKSVLQYGDEEYDHEQTSVSDEKNKAFLKFLHSIDAGCIDIDSHVQPGGDLTSYLRDLKSSASSHYYSDGSSYMPKSRESQELQAILRGLDSNWPLSFKQDSFSDAPSSGQFTRPVSRGPSPGPPSTPRSTYQVLSSRKLAASIKSGSYLGRPSSTVSDLDRDDADFEFLPVTRAVISQKSLSAPDLLNPEDLLTGRRGLGFRSVTNSSIGEETENESVTDSYFEFGKRKRASKRPDLAYQVEEDSVLEDSASNRGKSSKSGEQGEVHYEAGLQALGTLLSDSLSDKGDKSAAGDNLSRPASAKLSRPSSGKLSRPSSGKISRPQSGKLSRPASGKLSRPASARGSPVVRPASPVEQNQNTTLDQQTSLEGDVTGSQIVDKTVDTLLKEQSKEIDSKQTDENLSKTDKVSIKTVSEQESKGGRPLSRQKALKMKKPVQQRQRPGKAAKQAEPEKTSIHGGYIPQEDTAKDTDDMKIEVQDVVPEIKIELDTSQTVGVDEEAVIDEAQDVALGVSSDADAHSIVSELDALGLRVPVKHKKKAAKEKEKVMIPTHLEEVLSRQPTRSYEALEADLEKRGFLRNGKVTELVDESLSGPTLAAVGEGLTEEELELAKQILEKKIRAATDKLDDKEKKPIKKKAAVKPGKKGKGRAKTPVDTRTDEEREQDEIKERQRLEKLKRDMEAKELQRKIAERKLLLKAQTDAASARSLEIQAEMERFQKEADEIQEAEDQARDAMADLRKRQREERETRRKADLERKKQEAISRREREKRQMEENKKKELEMLEKIADAEMRRRLREEEERKMYEEERLAQERLEEELREAQRQAEEEEERMKELERQAEEEAMQRLIEEREAAERHRRRLQEEKEAMEEAERVKEEYLRQEELRLLEEKQKLEADEIERREKEKLRLVELRRLEEEARARMQEELEKRRQEALARREFNIEHRQNSDRLKHGQGITRAWTFSYFVRWPRDSYERLMGEVDPKKKRFMPRPKKKAPPPVEEAEKPPENAAPN